MLIASNQELILDRAVGVEPADSAEDVEPSAKRVRGFIGNADLAVSCSVESMGLIFSESQVSCCKWRFKTYFIYDIHLEELVELCFCQPMTGR